MAPVEPIRAGDFMIPLDKYPHIPYWFTMRQTIAELENSELDINGRKSLPRVVLVFDEKYQLMAKPRFGDFRADIQ